MNTLQLASKHPEAFKALPEAYQNDDVLEFSVDVDTGLLWCWPKEEQEFALGRWDACFDPETKTWDDGSL